ncbi:MAG: NlpC/P60 family protein [Holophaga sp.]
MPDPPRAHPPSLCRILLCLVSGAWLLLLPGCSRRPVSEPSQVSESSPSQPLARMGFTIQAGAFAQAENAARLAEKLQAQGLNAVYYAAPVEGSRRRLYRVRFGDFPTRDAARARAEELRSTGVIEAFIVAAPEEPPLPRPRPENEQGLRANLVATADSYLGVPYLWGGTSGVGFDCSGLTMAVYQLNGLKLPRSSREQYARGTPVKLSEARKGDLLFFATGRSGAVSHVGIFVGGDSFIHAPKHGRTIAKEKLAGYYRERLVGVRSYV